MDTPGQERFRKDPSSPFHNLSPSGKGGYYDGAVVVFDATKPDTLDAVKSTWLPAVQRLLKWDEAAVVLLANKTDGEVQRSSPEVTDARLEKLQLDGVVQLFETSALNDDDITPAFETLVDHCLAASLGSSRSYRFEAGLDVEEDRGFSFSGTDHVVDDGGLTSPTNSFRPEAPPRIDPREWADAKKMAVMKAKAMKDTPEASRDPTQYTFSPRLVSKPPERRPAKGATSGHDQKRKQRARRGQAQKSPTSRRNRVVLVSSGEAHARHLQDASLDDSTSSPSSSSSSSSSSSPLPPSASSSNSSPRRKSKTREMPIEEAYEQNLITGAQYQRLLFRNKQTVLVREIMENSSTELRALKNRMKSKRVLDEEQGDPPEKEPSSEGAAPTEGTDSHKSPSGKATIVHGRDVTIEDAFERGLISAREYETRLNGPVATVRVEEEEWRIAEANLTRSQRERDFEKNKDDGGSSIGVENTNDLPAGPDISIEDALMHGVITGKEYQARLERGIDKIRVGEAEWRKAERDYEQSQSQKESAGNEPQKNLDVNAAAARVTDGKDVSIEDAWERGLIKTKEYDSYLEQGVAMIQVSEVDWEHSRPQGLACKEPGLQLEEAATPQEGPLDPTSGRQDTRFQAIKSALLNPARIVARIEMLEREKIHAVTNEDFGLASSLKKELATVRGIQLGNERSTATLQLQSPHPHPPESFPRSRAMSPGMQGRSFAEPAE